MPDERTQAEKFPAYFVKIGSATVDVYRVLKAFNVTDPCAQHAIKKLLLAGKRTGRKTYLKDIMEARETLNRAIEMENEDVDAIESIPEVISRAPPNWSGE